MRITKMDIKLSNLSQKVLLALKDDGPATIGDIKGKLNNLHVSSGIFYALQQLMAKKLVKKRKKSKGVASGQTPMEYFINPKADLPDLDISLLEMSSGSAGIASLPEIRKIVDSLSHAIDRIKSLEKLICTPKQRAVLQAIEKTGLKIKAG